MNYRDARAISRLQMGKELFSETGCCISREQFTSGIHACEAARECFPKGASVLWEGLNRLMPEEDPMVKRMVELGFVELLMREIEEPEFTVQRPCKNVVRTIHFIRLTQKGKSWGWGEYWGSQDPEEGAACIGVYSDSRCTEDGGDGCDGGGVCDGSCGGGREMHCNGCDGMDSASRFREGNVEGSL